MGGSNPYVGWDSQCLTRWSQLDLLGLYVFRVFVTFFLRFSDRDRVHGLGPIITPLMISRICYLEFPGICDWGPFLSSKQQAKEDIGQEYTHSKGCQGQQPKEQTVAGSGQAALGRAVAKP
jgi:hypothetical protein